MALLFGACVQDLDDKKEGKLVDGDDMALVTLSLATPATRAAATAAENAIAEIDVMLFDASDKFCYRARGTNITNENGDPYDTKKFEVRLPIGGPYKVVVFANARSAIATLANSITLPIATVVSTGGASRETVIDGIVLSLSSGAKMGATNFPMWGYRVAGLTITESSNSDISPEIKLTRAVARVDVSVASTVSNFALQSAYLYNYNEKGCIAPAVSTTGGNLDGYDGDQWKEDHSDNNEKKAFAPHVPSSAKVEGPLDYAGAFTKAIYTFEAEAGEPVSAIDDDWKENTCLVVGGLYDDGVHAPYSTYYRVEFYNTTDGNLALLRNHLYNVVITEVKGHGWPDKETAYDNLPSNIVVTITPWNDGGLNDVVFNDQHYLAVDKNHVTLYRDGSAKSFEAITDYGGWTIEIPAGSEWIEVADMSYTGGETKQTVSVSMKAGHALSAGDPDRSGHFYIVAGNLKKEITVTQLNEPEFWIAITDPTSGAPLYNLFFEAGTSTVAPLPQSFRVTWLPTSITNLHVTSSTPSGSPFLYATSTDFSTSPITDPDGSIDFTVQPPRNIVANERAARLDFSVTLDGQSRTLPIFLHQAPQPPTYEFSPDGAILTLFSNFPHGTTLDGMNTDNIPELAEQSNRDKVTKLVIEGDINDAHILGIKERQSTLALSKLESISLPDFTGTIPNSTVWEGDGAFYQATWLKKFEAPLAVGVAVGAFGRTALNYVYLPAAQTIGVLAFGYSNLTSIDLPAAQTIGTVAFFHCEELISVSAPNVTVVELSTFSQCSKLTSIDFLPYATEVGASSFAWCSSLTTLNLLSARSIGDRAFQECTKLKTLKLGYAGAISLETYTGTNNTFGLFGVKGSSDSRSQTIDLYLHPSVSPQPSGKVWNGYTWKSITSL
ncbi:MAG: leucine-rich repeat protein [Odoribacteraceae bacterium]|jgi:hypothetical protein|nr:leucine-rich repeat protein [Odoribacteraceae bacterium]